MIREDTDRQTDRHAHTDRNTHTHTHTFQQNKVEEW
jgi:hypothetical protein